MYYIIYLYININVLYNNISIFHNILMRVIVHPVPTQYFTMTDLLFYIGILIFCRLYICALLNHDIHSQRQATAPCTMYLNHIMSILDI